MNDELVSKPMEPPFSGGFFKYAFLKLPVYLHATTKRHYQKNDIWKYLKLPKNCFFEVTQNLDRRDRQPSASEFGGNSFVLG
jgi:hypothetical protein